MLEPAPHYGYRDGETPEYRDCDHCGSTLRVDRLDLVAEHNLVCGNPATPRELEILQLIADGHSPTEIATALNLAPATITTHIKRLRKKWKTRSSAKAIAIGFRQKLLR